MMGAQKGEIGTAYPFRSEQYLHQTTQGFRQRQVTTYVLA